MISVIGHAGLGNIIFYYANGLYHAKKYDEPIELIFIDVAKNTVISDGRKESTIKNYAYMGGHRMPKYRLEEFFPKLSVLYNVDIDQYSKGKDIFHEPQYYSPGCIYNIGKWNYNFIEYLGVVRDYLTISPHIAAEISTRHSIDFSKPCVHLRLGSLGDNFGRHEDYLKNVKQAIQGIGTYYVISEDAHAAKDWLNDANAIVIDEPCQLSALYLLSCFKELMLSKSTLGMWGAYLSRATVFVASGFEDDWHKTNNWQTI